MAEQSPSPTPRWKRHLPDLALLLFLLVGRASFADHYHVPSGSMEPTLAVKDHILVDKRAYGLRVPLTETWLTEREPTRGDVVVFAHPRTGETMVKRLVGLPGDTVALVQGRLWLNGAPVAQTLAQGVRREALPGAPHPLAPEEDQGPDFGPLQVPAGEYLMLGDHRGNSADSRMWGLVPRAKLLGRALAVVYSARDGLSGTERLWLPLTPGSEDPRLLEPHGD
ncbi:signal peptidase I [Myxococcus sp. RHSTA-1-4]|uniref:signal peptidase I n=1 Tax=Myxococcus sp. RHSTA-1-4 TaxID=2874601 RepID=UPI001CBC52A7|nr:signal peptidase I [Myxococcus sp. RHSTA-1-4]MBZ4422559.1 signal peptidase I [Myxococcus sp. RHSTA-1-4]